MDRLPKKISIARGNWPTVLIRCDVVSMNELRVATDSNKAISRAINRAINKDSSKGNRDNNKASKGRKDSRASKERTASKVRDRKVSRDRTASNRVANKLVVHKAVAA